MIPRFIIARGDLHAYGTHYFSIGSQGPCWTPRLDRALSFSIHEDAIAACRRERVVDGVRQPAGIACEDGVKVYELNEDGAAA